MDTPVINQETLDQLREFNFGARQIMRAEQMCRQVLGTERAVKLDKTTKFRGKVVEAVVCGVSARSLRTAYILFKLTLEGPSGYRMSYKTTF